MNNEKNEMESLRSTIENQIKNIINNREKVKEDFLRAFLAVNMPDNATQDWIINNIILCIQPAHSAHDNAERHWIELRDKQ